MTSEIIETFAIRCALGNNGGKWSEHYTEEQKEHWRQFVGDLIDQIKADEKQRATEFMAQQMTYEGRADFFLKHGF